MTTTSLKRLLDRARDWQHGTVDSSGRLLIDDLVAYISSATSQVFLVGQQVVVKKAWIGTVTAMTPQGIWVRPRVDNPLSGTRKMPHACYSPRNVMSLADWNSIHEKDGD